MVPNGQPALVRRINDRRALDLLLAHGPLSRTELRARTGLSQPTVLDLIKRLLETGAVIDAGHDAPERPGRRGPSARLYDIDPSHGLAAAVSVSAGSVEIVLADLRGQILAEDSRAVDTEGTADQIALLVLELLGGTEFGPAKLEHVVVGTHGQVERRTGDLGFAWDLPQWEHSMIQTLRDHLPCPVTLARDVDLALVAEQAAGTMQGLSDGGLLWIGVGLGYAGLMDGAPLRGASGAAGQIGYMPSPGASTPPLPPHHDRTEGYPGGLQSLIGFEALTALAGEHGVDDAIAEISRPSALLDAYAQRIALGLAAVVSLLDPGTVALAGSIGHAGGQHLADAVDTRLAAVSPVPSRVVPGAFGADGVLRGALELAVRAARDAAWGSGLG